DRLVQRAFLVLDGRLGFDGRSGGLRSLGCGSRGFFRRLRGQCLGVLGVLLFFCLSCLRLLLLLLHVFLLLGRERRRFACFFLARRDLGRRDHRLCRDRFLGRRR